MNKKFIYSMPWRDTIVKKAIGEIHFCKLDDFDATVDCFLGSLPDRKREIIILRNKEKMTLQSCASRFGVTKTCVHQNEMSAYRKFRRNYATYILRKKRGDDKIVAELGLSVRANNVISRIFLKDVLFITIAELVLFVATNGVDELIRIRNCGRKTAEEILMAIEPYLPKQKEMTAWQRN